MRRQAVSLTFNTEKAEDKHGILTSITTFSKASRLVENNRNRPIHNMAEYKLSASLAGHEDDVPTPPPSFAASH
jgi:hypothetical protein